MKPDKIWCGTATYHPKPTLLLCGLDLDKNAERDFKLTDIDMSTMRRTDEKEQNGRRALQKIFRLCLSFSQAFAAQPEPKKGSIF